MKKLQEKTKTISKKFILSIKRIIDISIIILTGYISWFFITKPYATDQFKSVSYIKGLAEVGLYQYSLAILTAATISFIVMNSDLLGLRLYKDFFKKGYLEIRQILIASFCVSGLLVLIAFFLKISTDYSRIWTLTWYVLTMFCLLLYRFIINKYIKFWIRNKRFSHRTVLIGNKKNNLILKKFLHNNTDEIAIIKTFSTNGQKIRKSKMVKRDFILLDKIIKSISLLEVDQIILNLSLDYKEVIEYLTKHLSSLPAALKIVPSVSLHNPIFRKAEILLNIPVISIIEQPISDWGVIIKRIEDILLSLIFFIILSPVFFLSAIAIKISSPGPIFFKQQREGFNNKQFIIWKFRTMYQSMSDPGGKVQAKKKDIRVTVIGNLLRKYSIDEIPQLINVFKGNMSLIGPRPHPIGLKKSNHIFLNVEATYAKRFKVKPGMTGWAQVNGFRGETNNQLALEKRIECDLYYIDNWSILFDMWILIRTIPAVIKNRNAY